MLEKLAIATRLCEEVGKFNAAQGKYIASIQVDNLGADGWIQFWVHVNNPEYPVDSYFFIGGCKEMWKAIGIMRRKGAEQRESRNHEYHAEDGG